jgi:mono/diheme cytochrome c family protein
VNDSRIIKLLAVVLLSGGLGGGALAAEPAPAVTAHGDGKVGWELFSTYCTECHNTDDWAGGVAFDTMSEADIPQNIDVFEKVVRKLRSQQMPPGGHKMPDKATRTALMTWMEGNLDAAGQAHEDPGHVGTIA